MKKKLYTLTISLACAAMCAVTYASDTGARLSRGIVRLHIVANSDSEEDQALKLRIRDRLLAATSASAGKEDAAGMLDKYEEIARREIADSGFNYGVKAEYGRFYFPTKDYGGLTYPAGEYDAVRVTLGEGEGQNWWCVLFPPLCYVKGSVDSSAAGQALKTMLSPEDYELITSGRTGRLPVKIKFKLVEFINSLKEKK